MKLGVMAALFAGMSLDDALAYCQKVGLGAVELPVGGYAGDPWKLAGIHTSKTKVKALKAKLAEYGLELQGISVHGNAIHPDPKVARPHLKALENAMALAGEFGTAVITFSGCPGGAPRDKAPNWVTCSWPNEYEDIVKYQWEKVLVPFWTKQNDRAKKLGIKIAFEAHPGFCVYNPETIVKLRKAAGKQLGANMDPSHFFWQGIDPLEATRYLAEQRCIFHVHAKDCIVNLANSRIHGTLDTKNYGQLKTRSWTFRTVGYGHGDEFWKPFVSLLRIYGYDGVVSIEHEDSLMSMNEGFEKAVAYLKNVIITQPAGQAWWF